MFFLQKENGSSLKEKPNALKGIHPSLLGWRPWPQKRHPGALEGGVRHPSILGLGSRGFIALPETGRRQKSGASLGALLAHPGAGEHLVEGGVRWDSTCTLNCYKSSWPGKQAQPGLWGWGGGGGGGGAFAQEHP